VEANAGFEHEESDRLLDEQTDDDGPVPRRHPETKLEHDEAQEGDRGIAKIRALRSCGSASGLGASVTHVLELKAESGAEDDCDDGEPAQGEVDVFWDAEEGLLYDGDSHHLDGGGDDRVGDKAEGDDKDEGPAEDRLHDPSVAGRVNGDGGDPPAEDEKGKTDEAHDTDKAVAAG